MNSDWTSLEDVSQAVKSTADPTRLRLLHLCAESDLTVSELTRILGHSQPRISRHLKVMVDSGVLSRHPEGTWVFYRLSDHGGGADLARSLARRLPIEDAVLRQDLENLAHIKRSRRELATAYFDSIAHDWDAVRQMHGAEQAIESAVQTIVAKDRPETLVDIGTGTGRLLSVNASIISRGIGIDLSHQMLQVARSNLDQAGIKNCTVRHADMYRLPFENSYCDSVLIHQVLHYADDPQAVLIEAARILKPSGKLLVIDFAPHTIEELRERHQHRRLGFTTTEIEQWCYASELTQVTVENIPGDKLSVNIWAATKSEC